MVDGCWVSRRISWIILVVVGINPFVVVNCVDVVVGDTVVVEVVVVEDDKIFDIGDVNSSKNVRGVGGDVVKAEGKMGEKNPPERILDLSGNFGAGTRRPWFEHFGESHSSKHKIGTTVVASIRF